jgi:hypothetical protein
MRVSTIISLVISALVASATAEELKIEKVKEIECVRKTKVWAPSLTTQGAQKHKKVDLETNTYDL